MPISTDKKNQPEGFSWEVISLRRSFRMWWEGASMKAPQTDNILEKELSFYAAKKQDFLKTYKDQFVLIKNKELIGSYTTEAEAYAAGVEKMGNKPFLIEHVTEEEEKISFPALSVGVMNVSL